MRPTIAIAAALCGMTFVSAVAEAQQRRGGPLVVRVQPRSYFDAGRIPLPGSTTRSQLEYVTFMSTPAWSNFGERYGEGVLPPRIGAGANPFGRF